MSNRGYVLDTNTIIFLTARGSVIPQSLQDDLDRADLFTSVVTEVELFGNPVLPADEEEKLRGFLSERITVIEFTDQVKKETIKLRRTTTLKLPDCMIAATVIVLNAVLLTADPELLRLNRPGYKARDINKYKHSAKK